MSRNPNQHRGLVPSQHFRNPFDPEPEIDGLTKWESEHKGLTYRVRYTYYSDVNGQIVRRVIETEEADRWIEDFDIDNFNRTDPPVIWWDQGADGSIDSLVTPELNPPAEGDRQWFDPEPELDGLRKETEEFSADYEQEGVLDFRYRYTRYYDADNRLRREVIEYGMPIESGRVDREVTDFNYLDENNTHTFTWSDLNANGSFDSSHSKYFWAPSDDQKSDAGDGGITNGLPPISIPVAFLLNKSETMESSKSNGYAFE